MAPLSRPLVLAAMLVALPVALPSPADAELPSRGCEVVWAAESDACSYFSVTGRVHMVVLVEAPAGGSAAVTFFSDGLPINGFGCIGLAEQVRCEHDFTTDGLSDIVCQVAGWSEGWIQCYDLP